MDLNYIMQTPEEVRKLIQQGRFSIAFSKILLYINRLKRFPFLQNYPHLLELIREYEKDLSLLSGNYRTLQKKANKTISYADEQVTTTQIIEGFLEAIIQTELLASEIIEEYKTSVDFVMKDQEKTRGDWFPWIKNKFLKSILFISLIFLLVYFPSVKIIGSQMFTRDKSNLKYPKEKKNSLNKDSTQDENFDSITSLKSLLQDTDTSYYSDSSKPQKLPLLFNLKTLHTCSFDDCHIFNEKTYSHNFPRPKYLGTVQFTKKANTYIDYTIASRQLREIMINFQRSTSDSLLVIGHTDIWGDRELSLKRSFKVLGDIESFLKPNEECEVLSRIKLLPLGNKKLLNKEKNEAAQSVNRRVDIYSF